MATPTPTCASGGYTQQQLPCLWTYNAETMTYSAEFTFITKNIDLMATMIAEAGSGTWSQTVAEAGCMAFFPKEVQVTHRGFYQYTGSFTQTVRCFQTMRRLQNTESDANAESNRLMTILYEGRVIGIHNCAARTQTAMTPLYRSLTKVGTTYPGIGAHHEGVSRPVPVTAYVVTEVIEMSALAASMDITYQIAGSVNEANWQPPWEVPAITCFEGQWLYLGVTQTQVDKRTRTVALFHEFERMQDREQQHYYKWHNWLPTRDTSVPPRVGRKYDECPQTGKIHMIAGTDKWWDKNECTTPTDPGTTIPTFDYIFPFLVTQRVIF